MRCDERRLLDFLEARLSCQESAAVAEHIQNCVCCRERVHILAALIAIYRDQTWEGGSPRPARFLNWKVLATAAAALTSLLLVTFLGLTPQDPPVDPRQLATQESYPYFPLETRGPTEESPEEEAFSAYARRDYRRASELFGNLPPGPEVRFYHGVSLYLAGRPARALDSLRDPAVLGSAWKIPALWYQVQALLRLNRASEALQVLEREEFADGRYQRDAARLKEELRRTYR